MITDGDLKDYNMSPLMLNTIAERPGCQLKKNLTTNAMDQVYKEISQKLHLSKTELIDAFNLFGGVESLHHSHDEFYCDGFHLNSAGSAMLGMEVFKALKKSKIIPNIYEEAVTDSSLTHKS